MKATIAWWDLARSSQTIDSLREYLRTEGVKPWADVPGLRLKFWIADRAGNRWGAVMLWETVPSPDQPLPPHRAAELIGYPPTERIRFDVEACVEGIFTEAALSGGVTTHAVGRWVAKGLLNPAVVTPGGRYRFRWSEVAAQLKAQQDAREQGQASERES